MSLVAEFYRDAQQEWDRLDIPLFRIELATTLELIDSYFKKGDRVADIGGGPGRYMIELLRRGCRATLFELSPENVAFAEAKVAEMGLTADAFPYVGPSNSCPGRYRRSFYRRLRVSVCCGSVAEIAVDSFRIASVLRGRERHFA